MKIAIAGYGVEGKASFDYWNQPGNDLTIVDEREHVDVPQDVKTVLGRHQMGAQTVAQISNFYTNRYFADGIVKNYDKVPEAINKITRELMTTTAESFIAHGTWVLAGVSSEERESITQLADKFDTLFP